MEAVWLFAKEVSEVDVCPDGGLPGPGPVVNLKLIYPARRVGL